MVDNVAQRVFLVPEHEVEKNFSVIRLKHPKSGSAVLCALDSPNKLYEIVHFMDEFSSWFAGNSVIQEVGGSGLMVGSRLWGQRVPGSKPDSIEDLSCVGPVAH
ncbi:hypothetical protein AVEN_265376-1 [Araneus ventricosus]|uniref:Uncharacterized protein n=1 Tax=Araneus ventricosus TaxID=182803 RepID=A0A4Y2IQV8_ARAVE|nr:hypothetical protein AVEN_265376-1 [Araneus ventricosus]